MKTTITDFQRQFRDAREAADKGESVLITGSNAEYIFMRRPENLNPFEGLENVFGAVALGTSNLSNREKIRSRLSKNNRG